MEYPMRTAKYILIILTTFIIATVISGCSLTDYFLSKKADDETLYWLSDPDSDLSTANVGIDSAEGDIEAKTYVDEKTGAMITRTQYYAYHITDAVKLYGLYITVPCFAIGFLIRRFVHTSAAVRKWGLVLELAIPFVYVLLAYVLSAVADNL